MKATYILYARSGKEFTVADDLRLIGIDVWCGRVIRWKRKGKDRRPEAYEEPALPNYLWAEMTAQQFYAAQKVKHLSPTMQMVPHSATAGLQRFQRMADDAFKAQDAARRKAEAPLPEFDVGQALKLVGGPFADMVVKFRGVINASDALRRQIEADGPFGRIRVDPFDVKAAE